MTNSIVSRKQITIQIMCWHVRMINNQSQELADHPGWIVRVNDDDLYPVKPGNKPERDILELTERSWKEAIARVKALGLDNDPDGEWNGYPDLTADILEFNPNGVAELY